MENTMDKLRDEMAKKSDHPGVSVLGEYFTARLMADQSVGEKLGDAGKTLEGAFGAIRSYAQKHQKGGCAFVPPEKAFAIACEYYGIPYEAAGMQVEERKEEKNAADDLDLDALMGL